MKSVGAAGFQRFDAGSKQGHNDIVMTLWKIDMQPRTAFNFRIPDDLRDQAQALADYDGVSLNAICVQALRSHVQFHSKRLGSKLSEPHQQRARSVAKQETPPGMTPYQSYPKVGANQPCPCGSGQKYRRCHGKA